MKGLRECGWEWIGGTFRDSPPGSVKHCEHKKAADPKSCELTGDCSEYSLFISITNNETKLTRLQVVFITGTNCRILIIWESLPRHKFKELSWPLHGCRCKDCHWWESWDSTVIYQTIKIIRRVMSGNAIFFESWGNMDVSKKTKCWNHTVLILCWIVDWTVGPIGSWAGQSGRLCRSKLLLELFQDDWW